MALHFQSEENKHIKDLSHISDFQVGDAVVVDTKIQEGDKVRVQKFKGIVIRISGRGENRMFTVRHISPGGMGVERSWPFISPWVQKLTVEKQGEVRRSKLYYLRGRKGKAAKVIKARTSSKTQPKAATPTQ
ncbi:MAG: 50S ribosomal protein L19 [bacterium]|nr:50S ribosomal protein L19 [bacterium]